MSTLSDLLAEHTTLTGSAVEHLQRLVSEWQLLADLAFSDLTMWAASGPGRYVCVAQVRPTTGATTHPDDLVARIESGPLAGELTDPALRRVDAVAVGSDTVGSDTVGSDAVGSDAVGSAVVGSDVVGSGEPVERTLIPVRLADAVIAVLIRDTVNRSKTGPSALETAYLDAAESLLGMVADGSFPQPEQSGELHTGPRAGDGLLRLDPDGSVEYISPNALSAYHRLGFAGEVTGADLATLTRRLVNDPFDAAELAARITGAVHGRPSRRMEVEARGATVLFRSLPLLIGGAAAGALVLVRDVTEVRRRDRALLSKDATIREIHHRVKNNLQTVAALLRLQSRRSPEESVRHALNESVRRVSSIALVHETLSTAPDDRVDLDAIVDRLVPMFSDVAAAESPARIQRRGSFGVLTAELATPLVMALAEVVQNAMQHAYPGGGDGETVVVDVQRSARELTVTVIDDGQGLPPGFSLERTAGLGLQIVRTLVDAELGGSIGMHRRDDPGGTEVTIKVPLRRR